MNDICKKCTEFKDKNCKGMEKFYSGCIYFKSERRRESTTTIIIDQPSIGYYISVPAMDKEIRGRTNGLIKEKVIITITTIK